MVLTLLSLYISGILHTTPTIALPQSAKAEYSNLLDVSPVPYEKKKSDGQNTNGPNLEAKVINVVDLKTGISLYSRNADEKRSIGSITKLMTAIIILEENSISEIATVSQRAAKTEGSTVWLYAGEKITIENLLYSMLVHSGNDAAYALAEHNAGNVEKFVEKMNKKAQFLGLYSTKLSNPAGFDNENNYSTANDIAILSKIAYKKPFIRRATSIQQLEIKSVNEKTAHKLENTNTLLGKDPRVKGLKTGHTKEAGLSFVAVATNERGNDIITIILDSPKRFTETEKLIDWIFENFVW